MQNFLSAARGATESILPLEVCQLLLERDLT